jgi:hypothetical protein
MDDGVTVDIYPPDRIDWSAGPDWSGRFQPQFFGTLTALLLAWRGSVPIHGTAVEIDGKAWLICGKSGAGKSTLGAALVASGAARLISDDLSALAMVGGATPALYAGRPGMRLFPTIARFMEQAGAGAAHSEPGNDKLVIEPPGVPPFSPIRLAALILLEESETNLPWQKEALLRTRSNHPVAGRDGPDVVRAVSRYPRLRRLHVACEHHIGTDSPTGKLSLFLVILFW